MNLRRGAVLTRPTRVIETGHKRISVSARLYPIKTLLPHCGIHAGVAGLTLLADATIFCRTSCSVIAVEPLKQYRPSPGKLDHSVTEYVLIVAYNDAVLEFSSFELGANVRREDTK